MDGYLEKYDVLFAISDTLENPKKNVAYIRRCDTDEVRVCVGNDCIEFYTKIKNLFKENEE